ncbi:MAG: winged helix-turn-helix transcriptional regulator [bacterium]|nr:winged helix-turn-helix transcriptional regulator [bacterium]
MKKTETTDQLPSGMKAMADPTRLKILLMLEGQGRSVGEIVSFFNLSQPTITRHLQTLLAAGMVVRKRAGQQVLYELNAENVKSFCVQLVGCFPCCCNDVQIAPAPKRVETKANKRSEHAHREKRKPSRDKGERT